MKRILIVILLLTGIVFLATKSTKNTKAIEDNPAYKAGLDVFQNLLRKTTGINSSTAPTNASTTLVTENNPTSVDTNDQNSTQESTHGYQNAPIVNISHVSYIVRGNNRKDLCDQIDSDSREVGKNKLELGNIEYKLSYSYETISSVQGFTIGDFTVTTDSKITVPQWESSGGAPEETKNDWRVFKNEVVDHENKHQQILVEKATKLVQIFNTLKYYKTEHEVDTTVKNEMAALLLQLDKAQDKFDKEEDGDTFTDFCTNKY